MANSNIAALISGIEEARDTIRSKFVELGISQASDKLSDLADDASHIENKGAIQATVVEGSTYTIPRGYHNGSGTVTGLSNTAGDAEKYKLQTKTATPTTKEQTVSPDSGYYGLSSVTVKPIPSNYKDVSSTTATEADVRVGKVFIDADGETTSGTMATLKSPSNNTSWGIKTTDYITENPENGETYNIYQVEMGTGYLESGTAWTKAKEIAPEFNPAGETISSGSYFIDKVTIPAVPDTTIATDNVLSGKTYYNAGALKTGTMTNNGAYTATMTQDDAGFSSGHYLKKIPKGYHDGEGYIEVNAGEVSVTPTESTQTINPTTGYGFITKVNVAAINKDVKLREWTKDATATVLSEGKSPDILIDKTAYVFGAKITGTMPNNGKVVATLTGLTTDSMSYTIPKGYHDGTGTVSLTSDIEQRLSRI